MNSTPLALIFPRSLIWITCIDLGLSPSTTSMEMISPKMLKTIRLLFFSAVSLSRKGLHGSLSTPVVFPLQQSPRSTHSQKRPHTKRSYLIVVGTGVTAYSAGTTAEAMGECKHRARVNSACFVGGIGGEKGDATAIATCADDKTVRFFRAIGGKPLVGGG